jgi:three-Cys-motif partner protein
LLDKVFPKIKWDQFRRGLCLLDPYGLHLNWEVLETAGKMKSIEIFLNFPTMDMNRNALWRNPEQIGDENAARMTAFWGDESWKTAAYAPSIQKNLFGEESIEKESNYSIAEKFRERLQKVAGFSFVPEPIPMRNSTGATLYYLFFASQNSTADRIGRSILNKYKNKDLH